MSEQEFGFFSWSASETPQVAVTAALNIVRRKGWKPARIVFRTGERQAVNVPEGIEISEADNVAQRHFQVWQ